jgi:excinuclease ABC subunit C
MQWKQVTKLPDSPGVYIFKKGTSVLYVGRATSLRDRVRSYFGDDLIETRGPLLVDMVTLAKKVEHIKTDSVLEAIILEANLIKKYQPKYNTLEKDDKSFNYVVITDEEFPIVHVIRERELELHNETDFKAIFGPFPNGAAIREGLAIIRRIFPFHDGSSIKRDQMSFYRQIGLAPDFTREDAYEAYNKNIDNVILFFQGKKKELVKSLEKDMMTLAKELRFEEANKVKQKIVALTHIRDVSLIKREELLKKGGSFRVEAYDISHISGKNMVGVMTVVTDGHMDKSEYRKFRIRGYDTANDVGALAEVIKRRLGHPEWLYPNLVVVDGSVAQKRRVETIFNELGIQIPVVAVVKNERHKPKAILGNKKLAMEHEKSIILANAESHRFSVRYHQERRSRVFK